MVKVLLSRSMLILYAAVFFGASLLLVSQAVQRAEHQLSVARADIAGAHEDIHVLRAEWQYLNAPQRLEFLAAQHLGLERPGYKARLPDSLSKVFVGPQSLPSPNVPSAQNLPSYMHPVSLQQSLEGD